MEGLGAIGFLSVSRPILIDAVLDDRGVRVTYQRARSRVLAGTPLDSPANGQYAPGNSRRE